jgi:hypothetical protein
MDLVTLGLVAIAAWIVLLAFVVALCTASSRADASTDRLARLL